MLNTKIKWGMIISHHAPIDYDRTLKIYKFRFCTRCLGVFIGFIFTLLLLPLTHALENINMFYFFIFFLPIPAVIDFLCHELQWFKSNNYLRLLSGILLGVPIGLSILFIKVSFIYLFLLILWYVVIEFFVAYFLKSKNHLEKYLRKYTNAIYK